MGRKRSLNREKAFEIYKENNGKITSKEIAILLNEKINNITNWRSKDHWSKRVNKIGAPIGNKNAIGNKGGGAPKGNINSFKLGNYSKRIPLAVKTIMEELNVENPIEKLWKSICLQEARIIHMQNIMHVKDKKDLTKILKKVSDGTVFSEEYEIQFAWDKEANLINTQSKALTTLSKLIKQYTELVNSNPELATEEQRLRVEQLKYKIENKEFEHKKSIDNKKLELERERFEHVKEMDKLKIW